MPGSCYKIGLLRTVHKGLKVVAKNNRDNYREQINLVFLLSTSSTLRLNRFVSILYELTNDYHITSLVDDAEWRCRSFSKEGCRLFVSF